jgi:hypothetical protein
MKTSDLSIAREATNILHIFLINATMKPNLLQLWYSVVFLQSITLLPKVLAYPQNISHRSTERVVGEFIFGTIGDSWGVSRLPISTTFLLTQTSQGSPGIMIISMTTIKMAACGTNTPGRQ